MGEALLYPVVAVVSVLRVIGRTDLGMHCVSYVLYIWFLVGLLEFIMTGKLFNGKTVLECNGSCIYWIKFR